MQRLRGFIFLPEQTDKFVSGNVGNVENNEFVASKRCIVEAVCEVDKQPSSASIRLVIG